MNLSKSKILLARGRRRKPRSAPRTTCPVTVPAEVQCVDFRAVGHVPVYSNGVYFRTGGPETLAATTV